MNKEEIIENSLKWFEECCYENPPNELMLDIARCLNHALNLSTQDTENTIKDDRECKTCGKKLTEHSAFYDDHTYIPKKKNEVSKDVPTTSKNWRKVR